jgi:hypothetical protein
VVFKQQRFISHSSGNCKFRTKALADLMSEELTFWFIGCISLHSHMVEEARELSGASFVRTLIPFMRTTPLT